MGVEGSVSADAGSSVSGGKTHLVKALLCAQKVIVNLV